MPAVLPVLPPRTPPDVRGNLRHSILDGCGHAVMIGSGEAYLSAYAIALGAGSLGVGLVATVPVLVGACAQLLALALMRRVPQRRRLVTVAALAQGLLLLPLALLPRLVPELALPLLGLTATAYFACGGLTVPPWNSWIGDVVHPSLRGRFFGAREQARMVCQTLAMLSAGAILQGTGRVGRALDGFLAVFAIATLARSFSARHLHAMSEPDWRPVRGGARTGLRAWLAGTETDQYGRFAVYIALVMGATALSGPLVSLYLLRELQLDYAHFTIAAATTLLAQGVAMRRWGALVDRFGSRRLLIAAGLLVPWPPLLWLLSTRFEWVLLVQAASGLVWAGFNLAVANLVFDAAAPDDRPRAVAFANVLTQGATVAGAVIGGALAPLLPARVPWLGAWLPEVSSLHTLFLASGLLRLLLALAFLPSLRRDLPARRERHVQRVPRVAGLSAMRGARVSLYPEGEEPSDEASVDAVEDPRG